jgi:hypothetical protein
MPADPQLVEYAERLDVLAGVSRRRRERGGPGGHGRRRGHPKGFACLSATYRGKPRGIKPQLPEPVVRAAVPEPIDVSTPQLPQSPVDAKAISEQRESNLAELYRLLNVYMQLCRHTSPGFGLPAAQAELAAEVGVVNSAAPDDLLAEALDWIRERTAQLAIANPDVVKDLARAQRRNAIGAAA